MSKLAALLKERSLWIFLAIGLFNTVLNWALMLWLYNTVELNYWAASAIGFAVTSAISFVLNRRFSFRSEGDVKGDLIRFIIVIAACYVVAYAVARPLVIWVMQLPRLQAIYHLTDQVALIFGNIIFTGLNYFGQKLFAFKRRDK